MTRRDKIETAIIAGGAAAVWLCILAKLAHAAMGPGLIIVWGL